MKSIFLSIVFILSILTFSSCDLLDSLLSKVEVNYDIDFDPNDNSEAVVTYYAANGDLIEETIPAGEWSYKGIFDDGQKTGVWVKTEAQGGYLSAYLVIWYSELNDLEDYVDANTWSLPINGAVGLEAVVQREKPIKTYPVVYTVEVEGTNGVPVEILYSDKDYDSQSLLSEATHTNGVWQYNEEFPVGAYTSVTVKSAAVSGFAKITISIDYDDKPARTESLIVDFSSATKTGSLGFPVE